VQNPESSPYLEPKETPLKPAYHTMQNFSPQKNMNRSQSQFIETLNQSKVREGFMVEEDDVMRVYRQLPKHLLGVSQWQHPETGETIYVNKENLMRNTQISPFQNSVRDTSNYYFTHAKTLE